MKTPAKSSATIRVTMKFLQIASLTGWLFAAPSLFASVTSSQGLVVAVSEIYAISVSSPSVTMNLVAPQAGSDFAPAVNSSTSYNLSVNSSQTRKITAGLNQVLPSGVSLNLSLAAPSGATSQDATPLTTAAQDVVRGVSHIAASNLNITYTLNCLVGQSAVGSGSAVVSITLVNQ